MIKRAIFFGLLGALVLFNIYFAVLTLVSGWQFALRQFFTYWYFIIALALGFGIQIGLYTYLRNNINSQKQSGLSAEASVKAGKIVAVSGTTSTIAMISCCSHYLVNILPVLGAVGFITIISQYQIQLFWVGIIANLLGIIYMLRKLISLKSRIKSA